MHKEKKEKTRCILREKKITVFFEHCVKHHIEDFGKVNQFDHQRTQPVATITEPRSRPCNGAPARSCGPGAAAYVEETEGPGRPRSLCPSSHTCLRGSRPLQQQRTNLREPRDLPKEPVSHEAGSKSGSAPPRRPSGPARPDAGSSQRGRPAGAKPAPGGPLAANGRLQGRAETGGQSLGGHGGGAQVTFLQ